MGAKLGFLRVITGATECRRGGGEGGGGGLREEVFRRLRGGVRAVVRESFEREEGLGLGFKEERRVGRGGGGGEVVVDEIQFRVQG